MKVEHMPLNTISNTYQPMNRYYMQCISYHRTLGGAFIWCCSGEKLADEDKGGHVECLEDPVPHELLSRAIFVEADDKKEGHSEEDRRDNQIRNLRRRYQK